jgi:hypothetical protein
MLNQWGYFIIYYFRRYFKFFFREGWIPQKNNISLLRSKILKIEEMNSDCKSCCDIAWINNKNLLRNLIIHENPFFFLDWDVIRSTMFHDSQFVEFEFLKKSHYWDTIQEGLKESSVGNPPPYRYYPKSSGNLIHHMYSLINFLNFFKLNFSDISGEVFEFGGGYGSFCRLFYNLGFSGNYTIFDQPEFSVLQEFYLNSIFNEIPITLKEDSRYKKSIILLSNHNDLIHLFSGNKKLDIFIALWSLSECPIDFRSEILNDTCKPDYFVFGYQDKFGEIDNKKYFEDLIHQENGYIWITTPIKHLPGNYYLYGKRRTSQDR